MSNSADSNTQNGLEAGGGLALATINEINDLIQEQGFYLFPALEIPEYGRFCVKISAPFSSETRTFTGFIEESMSTPTQKYYDLKSALEDATKEANGDAHIIYVEIGEFTIGLRIGQLSSEA